MALTPLEITTTLGIERTFICIWLTKEVHGEDSFIRPNPNTNVLNILIGQAHHNMYFRGSRTMWIYAL